MSEQDKKKWRMFRKAVDNPNIITLSGDEATPDFSKDWYEMSGLGGYFVDTEYGIWRCSTLNEGTSSYSVGDPKNAFDKDESTYHEVGCTTLNEGASEMFLGPVLHFPSEDYLGCPSQVSVTCRRTTKVKLVGRLKGSSVTETIDVYEKSDFSSKETIVLNSDGRYYQWIAVLCKCTKDQYESSKTRIYEVKFEGDCKLKRIRTCSMISGSTDNIIPQFSSTENAAIDERGETWTAEADSDMVLNGKSSGVFFDGSTTLYYTMPSSKTYSSKRVKLQLPEGYLITPSSISVYCRGTSATDSMRVYGFTKDTTTVHFSDESSKLSTSSQWVTIEIPEKVKNRKLNRIYVSFTKSSSTSAVYGPRLGEVRMSGTLYKVTNCEE